MDVASLPAWAALAVALVAGLASFLSPCVAPLLPGYLAYVAPEGARLQRSIGFVAGFTLLFAALGATAASISQMLLSHRAEIELVSGLLVALAGVAMTFDIRLVPARLTGSVHNRVIRRGGHVPTALVSAGVGAAFAIAWSPCIGPALAAILALAAGDGRPAWGATLLIAYGVGLGIPFIAGALALDRVTRASRLLRRHAAAIRMCAGIGLALVGILIATGRFGALTSRLAPLAPSWLL